MVSELGDRAAYNSNFDWIDALVGTEVGEVAPKSFGTLLRSTANPSMQGVDLLHFEMLGSFLVCAVTVCIVLPADVQSHVVVALVNFDLALAIKPIAHWASQPPYKSLSAIGSV
jgi:hypothetical protein